LQRLKTAVPNDPSVNRLIDEYTRLANKNKPLVPEQNK